MHAAHPPTPAAATRRPPTPARRHNDLYTRSMTDPTVSGDPDLATVIGLLDDDHVRSILAAASARPLSANQLSDRCDVSVSSIYRRVDRLVEADLLAEWTRPRADGHHETVYVSRLDRFELSVDDGDLSWDLERDDAESTDVADELTRLWGKF